MDRELFLALAPARMAAFDFIEALYNRWQRHCLGQISPAEFERQWRAARQSEEVMV